MPRAQSTFEITANTNTYLTIYSIIAYTNSTFTTVPEQNRLLFKYTVKCAILCHSKSTLWHSY